MRVPGIAADAWRFAFPLLAVALAGLLWLPWLAAIAAVLLVLTLWFFRDPERRLPEGEGLVTSAADGHVVWVREVEEPRWVGGRSVAVSVYLSLGDVHINRVPVSGEVVYRDYVAGSFRPASQPDVAETNERAYTGLRAGEHRVLVVQIAGRVARRIVTGAEVGDRFTRGERMGLIRFGSCTQVYLPAGSEVRVRTGERVRGGETVLGTLPR